MNTIGNRIHHMRTKENLSMAELAERIGSTSGTIALWENNHRLPGAKYIIALAEFFNVSTDWLLKGNDYDNRQQSNVSIRAEKKDISPAETGTIGVRIRHLRKKYSLSMGELAAAIGSCSGTIAQWENDSRLPGADYIVALADYFNVSTDWLLKGINNENIFFANDWQLNCHLETKENQFTPTRTSALLEECYRRIQTLPEEDIKLVYAMVTRLCKAYANS